MRKLVKKYLLGGSYTIPQNNGTSVYLNLMGGNLATDFGKSVEKIMAPTNNLIDFNAKMGDPLSTSLKFNRDSNKALLNIKKVGGDYSVIKPNDGIFSKAKIGNTMNIAGGIADTIGGLIPKKEQSALTTGLNQGYDAVANAVSAIPGVGTIIGGAMKVGGMLSDGLTAMGVGTDQMCVCAGTKVFTSRGDIINIENLSKEQGIIGWNQDTKKISQETIYDFITPTLKECLEIVLKSGYILRCSKDHPILADKSLKAKHDNKLEKALRLWLFIPAELLEIGNFVGLANDIDFWGDIDMPNAYLVGLLIGDGSYTKGNSCILTTADKYIWDYLEQNNLAVFKCLCDTNVCKLEVRKYRILDGMSLMRSLGIIGQKSSEKTLPKELGLYNKKSICNLLAGLFDTDGSLSINEEKDSYSITFYLTNINLINEIRWQLRKLGIFCSINTRKPADFEIGGKIRHSKESYRLIIKDKKSIIKFYENIPLNIEYKKLNLQRMYNYVLNKRDSEHNELSGAKLDRIIDIKDIGLLTVYNLQADENHTYLAEGIITHNTTADKILDSKFLKLTPIGLANAIGAKKAATITKDNRAFEQVGSSYGGTQATVDDALTKSGKKYGLLSGRARNKANDLIYDALLLQSKMSNIADEAQMAFAASNNPLLGLGTQLQLNGGYLQDSVKAGKSGLKMDREFAKRVVKLSKGLKGKIQEKVRIEKVVEFKNGVNVIPDGALHARKHHLEDVDEKFEEVTTKGIPVITEEKDGDIKQHAEVEREEIIFNLEITKQLEKLMKDGSDEAAIEAGKLLVHEILENTVDNTGLLNTIE